MAVYNLLAAAVLSAQRINEMLGITQEHPFSMDESGVVHMRWYITNRFTGDKNILLDMEA